MAAVLPCDAASCMQPCADRYISKAKRRVLRDRRNVIRHAQRLALELKQYLDGSTTRGAGAAWIPNKEAPGFIPWTGVEIDEASCHFTLKEEDIVEWHGQVYITSGDAHPKHRHPEEVSSTTVAVRRTLREPSKVTDLGVPTPVPALDTIWVKSDPMLLKPELKDEGQLLVPQRKCLRESPPVEKLTVPQTPTIEMCTILPQSRVSGRSASLTLARPARLYKAPHAYNTVRGMDVKALGEDHALCDKPMFIEGHIEVLQEGENRTKVSGRARAEAGGASYDVWGWIDKLEITEGDGVLDPPD